MRRAARITILVLALPAAIVALLVALWIALNTDAGRRVAERAVHRFSSERVTLSGLAGRFPDDLRLASLQVSDAAGPWLSVQDAVLRWSPLSLLTRRVGVAELSAAHVVVVRAPQTDASSTSFRSLPKTVDVGVLSIGRLELGEALAGSPATLTLQGSARLRSLDDASLALEARRLDAPGRYHVRLVIVDGGVTGDLQLDEPGDGVLAHLLQLPGLGAWHADGRIAGPRGAEAVDLQLMAGALQSRVRGTLDWTRHSADVAVSAHSTAMTPRADLHWDRLDLDGHWRGTLATANANADLALQGVAAGAAGVQTVTATVNSASGRVTLRASAAGVRLPGAHPDLLRNAPVRVSADFDLNAQPRAIRFTLDHVLLQARGSARLEEPLQADVTVRIPSLAPLAELAGVAVRGDGELQLRFSGDSTRGRIEGSGTVGITGGAPTLVALAGPSTRLRARVGWDRGRLRIEEARIAGAAIDASVQGERSVRQAWSLQWQVALPRLAALDAVAEGSADARGSVAGSGDALQGTALVHADVSFHGSPRGPLDARVEGRDLLTTPTLTLSVQGSLDAAPMVVAATVQRDASRSWRIRVPRGDWKSARLAGDLTLPAPTAASQTRAAGQLTLQIARLEDLHSLTGMPLSGSLEASLRAAGDNRLSLRASAANVRAQAIDADLRLAADGALDALAVQANATVRGLPDGDVQFAANGLVDVPSRRVRLDALEALYRKQVVRLRQPARVDFGDTVTVQGLRLSIGSGVVALDGQLTPTLAAQGTVRELDAAELAKWLPAGSAGAAPSTGRLTADASLQGTPQAPRGVLKVRATGLRWRNDVAQGLPALEVDSRVDLRGESAPQLTLQLTGGSVTRVSINGELPRTADGVLNLGVRGEADAGIANGFLEASGRRATGRVALDGRIAGTLQAPQISGRVTLRDGDLRDYAAGVHVGAITAELEARRDELVLTRFDARAGTGALQASGSIGVLQPGVPVSLHLTAHDAQPIDGQLLRARMDADLTLAGEFQGQLRLAGRISASRAEITIPGTLPTSVPTLDVRRPGHAAPVADSAAAAAQPLAIDVTIEAPRAVFVRGRGLDAEVGGELHWRGTRAAPLVSGGFELRSGRFNLAGKTLEFQSGRVSFNGQGIANQLDPTLDFVASNTSGGVTSTLKVGGYADAPLLTLSSSPERPQDEVLARLLFGASVTELSALQLAQMGAAVATLGGVGGGGGPLLSLQRSLGLDRLAISGAQGEGSGASVEAGRYVSRRVYVGTRQNTAGGAQGEVEVDLTQRLKMRAAFGAGAGSSTASAQGSTPTDQAGSTVGLSYELEF